MKIFPFYTEYNIEAQILNYPSEQITRIIKLNSRKSFKHNSFIKPDYQVRLNGIWHSEIQKRYKTNSEYEWQENFMELRTLCLSFVKMKVRLLEALVDNYPDRYRKLINEIEGLINDISKFNIARKKRPEKFNVKNKDKNESDIHDWEHYFILCFVSQCHHIVIEKFDIETKRLAKLNLQFAVGRLPKMQIAFDKILLETHPYFDTKNLSKEETEWYERLERSVLFYEAVLEHNYQRKFQTAKDDCENWYNTKQEKEFSEICNHLKEVEENIGMLIRYPKFLQSDDWMKKVTFGVEMFNFQNIEKDVLEIAYGLRTFIGSGLHGMNVIILDIFENVKFAFYISMGIIEKINHFVQTQTIEENEYGFDTSIIPLEINEELILPLEGNVIIAKEKSDSGIGDEWIKLADSLWHLTEHRNRLNLNSIFEKKWFEEIQRKNIANLKIYLNKVHGSSISQSIKDQIQNLYTEVIEGENYNSTQFGEFLIKIVNQHIAETDPMKEYNSLKN